MPSIQLIAHVRGEIDARTYCWLFVEVTSTYLRFMVVYTDRSFVQGSAESVTSDQALGSDVLTYLHHAVARLPPVCNRCGIPHTVLHIGQECPFYDDEQNTFNLFRALCNALRGDDGNVSNTGIPSWYRDWQYYLIGFGLSQV
jgi:hypothetical protein